MNTYFSVYNSTINSIVYTYSSCNTVCTLSRYFQYAEIVSPYLVPSSGQVNIACQKGGLAKMQSPLILPDDPIKSSSDKRLEGHLYPTVYANANHLYYAAQGVLHQPPCKVHGWKAVEVGMVRIGITVLLLLRNNTNGRMIKRNRNHKWRFNSGGCRGTLTAALVTCSLFPGDQQGVEASSGCFGCVRGLDDRHYPPVQALQNRSRQVRGGFMSLVQLSCIPTMC